MERIGIAVFFGVIVAVVVLFVGAIITSFTGWHYETGRGEHTGYITAVEKSGVLFKTGTAYLKTDTQSSQEDAYCVVDDQVYNQLQEYSQKKVHINAYFFSWLKAGVTNCNGEGQVIYKVEPLTN